jgi:hypothetical protein
MGLACCPVGQHQWLPLSIRIRVTSTPLPTKALSASLTQTQTLLPIYKEHAIGSKVALTSVRNLPHGVLFRGGSEAERGPIS